MTKKKTGKKGLIYFARNPAFQHLIKIGKTSKLNSVEKRGLTASNVPEDFSYPAVLECEDVDWVEKEIHEQFGQFRHYSSTGRKTEFFWSGCVKDALKYAKNLKGVTDVTPKQTEPVKLNKDGDEQIIKRPRSNTTFKMIGLKKGVKIYLNDDKKKWATVVDDKNKISYLGHKPKSISRVTDKVLGGSYSGFYHFYYKGERLFNLRPDMKK